MLLRISFDAKQTLDPNTEGLHDKKLCTCEPFNQSTQPPTVTLRLKTKFVMVKKPSAWEDAGGSDLVRMYGVRASVFLVELKRIHPVKVFNSKEVEDV